MINVNNINSIPNIKIQRLSPNAVIPFRAHQSDACFDLVATSITHVSNSGVDRSLDFIEYGLGFRTIIPEGYEAVIRPRSSISKYDLILVNSPATIDSNYRGEWKLRFKIIPRILLDGSYAPITGKPIIYSVGDKIAQVTIKRRGECIWDECDLESLIQAETEQAIAANHISSLRGDGAFGSTGSSTTNI